MCGSFMYGGRPSRDALHCNALQPLRSRKKKWAGGRVRRAEGRAVTPAARRDCVNEYSPMGNLAHKAYRPGSAD